MLNKKFFLTKALSVIFHAVNSMDGLVISNF